MRFPTRPTPLLALVVALAACGTPQQQCVSAATRDLRTLDRLIAETEGNLARGYGYEDHVIEDTRWFPCAGPDVVLPDGTIRPGPTHMCEDDFTRTERRPVAIDLAGEKAKLAAMKTKRAQLAKAAGPQIAACKARYPEG